MYRGNYSKYKILKAERVLAGERAYEKQQKEIAELKDYVARNIVRATTASSAQSRVKKLEKGKGIQCGGLRVAHSHSQLLSIPGALCALAGGGHYSDPESGAPGAQLLACRPEAP